jgi:hypothetical protein
MIMTFILAPLICWDLPGEQACHDHRAAIARAHPKRHAVALMLVFLEPTEAVSDADIQAGFTAVL